MVGRKRVPRARLPAWLLMGFLASVAPTRDVIAAVEPHPRARPEELKAAYMLNIVRFTGWPHEARPLRVSVYGPGALIGPLELLARPKNQDAPLWVIRRVTSPEECVASEVVIFDQAERTEIRRVTRLLEGRPILTVADAEDPKTLGCTLTFFQERSRLRFAVATDALTRSGLTMSSRLLELARVDGVDRRGRP